MLVKGQVACTVVMPNSELDREFVVAVGRPLLVGVLGCQGQFEWVSRSRVVALVCELADRFYYQELVSLDARHFVCGRASHRT